MSENISDIHKGNIQIEDDVPANLDINQKRSTAPR